MRFVLLIAALALSACQPAPLVKAPEPGPEPIHEDAPVFAGDFLPISTTAESITGGISFAVDAIRFDFGQVYETAPVKLVRDAEAQAAANIFAISDNSAMSYELRKVTSELVNAKAPNGGLCKSEAATFLLLGAKYNSDTGSSDVYLGAYRGKDEPGPTAKDSALCGTFMYARQP